MNFPYQLLTDCQELIFLSLCITVGILSWQSGYENPLPTLKETSNKMFHPFRIGRGEFRRLPFIFILP